VSVATLVAACMGFASNAWAAEGDLDPSFGAGGRVATPVGTSPSILAETIDAQGRIVVVGYVTNGGDIDMLVARYLPNGTLDPSFSTDGIETIDYPGSSDEEADAVAVDARGGLLIAGTTAPPHDVPHADFALIRLGPDGERDTGFGPQGSNGFVKTDLFGDGDLAKALAVDSQGRIVIAGWTHFGDYDFGVVRYDANGNLDASFGTGGKKNVDFTPLAGDDDSANAMTIDGQDRIVLAGESRAASTDDFAVARLNTDGSRDASFGSAASPGQVTTPMGSGVDIGQAVTIDSQNKIVVAGRADAGASKLFAVARYNADGSLDSAFSDDGKVITVVEGNGGEGDQAHAVAVDSLGRIVAAGRSSGTTGTDFALVRYLANGALDPTFGVGGKVTLANARQTGVTALALDDHERFVIAGNVVGSGGDQLGLARLIGDATAPTAKIDSGPADDSQTNDPTPAFEFSSSEAGGTFACGLDGLSAACTSPFSPSTPLSDGKHTFSLTATDRAGNASEAKTRTFKVDTKAPEIEIKGKKKVKTHRPKARDKLKITTSEPAELTCTVDHKKPEDCVKKFITPKLDHGKHKVTVTATDKAGNSSDEAKKIKVVPKP
jgi:uncharacterized delta-60 repeat protein